MQAITTKYLPETRTKPARIKASTPGGMCLTISYPLDDKSEEAAHTLVAKQLCEKLWWDNELVCGAIKGGYAFVLLAKSN